jgi:2-amino-4-hydroxy-6-hydroxymethyldihydropteridine diphosphokinase
MPKTGDLLPQLRSVALVALGSNLTSPVGDPRETVEAAIECARASDWVIRSVSRFYATPAFPAGSGPDFVNAVISIEVADSPSEILDSLHRIEKSLNRIRKDRWGERTIDLDLIAVGDQVLPDTKTFELWREMPLPDQMQRAPDHLILPHPRLQDRAFVLVPLADVAPDWVHPVLGRSVTQMRDALPDWARQEVRLLH